MRNAFADEVTNMAANDPRIVLLSGDIGNRLFNRFKDVAPGQFYNCGVAEANMTGMAAGMAMCGLRPITYTIVPFLTTRCLEQIRVDVCYHDLPVVIVGVGGGLSYASLGPTHHACEDIGFLRTIPGMHVVCCADAHEVRSALRAAVALGKPTYIRLGKKGEPDVHAAPPELEIGRAIKLREGADVCILGCGNLVPLAMDVANGLLSEGIHARVYSYHTVKPLDEAVLADAFANYRLVVTIEEHSRVAGLGAAVAEWLVDQPRLPASRLLRFATADRFIHEAGSQRHMRALNGLETGAIAEQIQRALA